MNTMILKTPLRGLLLPSSQMPADEKRAVALSGGASQVGPRRGGDRPDSVRHILLGSPEAVRQTIHLLHTLHYAETVLWSPVLTVEEPIVVKPSGCDAMSLLRRPV